jgi:hypothetical protein
MEGLSANMYKGFTGYWRRRGYEQLNGPARRRRARVQLGSNRRRRFWRIKTTPKVRLLIRSSSPKKLLLWLRDWYVNMMLRLGNSRMFASGAGGYGGAMYDAIGPFGRAPTKEYDEKVIVEIYRNAVMSQGLAM